MKIIYLAGGCFWGLEEYLSIIPGVVKTKVGYANGKTENPSYTDVCKNDTGHAETVMIEYDNTKLSLEFLLKQFYEVIDPTSLNKQGNDRGVQYRTGIYYVEDEDRNVILKSIEQLQQKYSKPIVLEVTPLKNFYLAEIYHQKYLEKNPGAYCHISRNKFDMAKNAEDTETRYKKKDATQLRSSLSSLQYEVTQNSATEPPFRNEYYDLFSHGIYVDITTGEPLFVSTDKFESGCGWPSFSKPISKDLVKELHDKSHGMVRVEVRSKLGDSHLGHVFTDGPKDKGGYRYCINSASLRFVPKDQMEIEGYRHLLSLVK